MNEVNNKITCPKCNSNQITAQKRGFNNTKAVVGGVVTGGVGLLAGLHGKDNINIYCLSCGNKWNPHEHSKLKEKYLKEKELNAKTTHGPRFISLYKEDKLKADEYAKENNLYSDGSESVDDLYKKIRSDIRGGYVVIGVVVLLIALLIYQCS